VEGLVTWLRLLEGGAFQRLIAANSQIANPDRIFPGQWVTIPS
jgi:hypothetical protein